VRRPLERAAELVDRRRLLAGLGAAVAVTLVAAIPGVLTDSGGGARRVRAAAGPIGQEGPPVGTVTPLVGDPGGPQPGPTVAPAPTTTTPANVLGVSFTQTSTTTRTPVITPPKPASTTMTTSTPTCRNSTDPSCGPFRWDPDPGPNQPATGQLTSTQTGPDHKLTFHVVANDPDATPVEICDISFGDGSNTVCDPRPAVDPSYCPKQYGPWTPPASKQGALDATDEHTYPQAGTYDVSFGVRSAMNDCDNPYASTVTLTATVIVT
jgi:hypothetical protein